MTTLGPEGNEKFHYTTEGSSYFPMDYEIIQGHFYELFGTEMYVFHCISFAAKLQPPLCQPVTAFSSIN